MTWFHEGFLDDDIWVILGQIDSRLNRDIAKRCFGSLKIGTCDIRHGKARGVVVWSDAATLETPHPSGSSWSAYTWSTNTDYESMYSGLAGALNQLRLPDGRTLTWEAAVYSRMCMTDMHGGSATLTLFWRT